MTSIDTKTRGPGSPGHTRDRHSNRSDPLGYRLNRRRVCSFHTWRDYQTPPSPRCLFTGTPGVFEPVKRHRGEPRHTRDTHGTHTGHFVHVLYRLPASASRVLSSSGALAAPPAVTRLLRASAARAFISPTAFEQARGGALGAGGGRVGFAGGGLF